MTLVYRSPKLQYSQPESTPGPTTYSQPVPKTTSSPSAVFTSKITRNLPLDHSEAKVGPGSYFVDENKNSKEKPIKESAAFCSKIERFKDDDESKKTCKKDEQEEDDQYKVVKVKIPGKVITTKQKKEAERDLAIPQRLPSIPSQEQSFGYRLDPSTKKLVTNDSPKIMFAKRMAIKEEDFFFQRVQSTLGKNQKTMVFSSVARSSPELKHLLDLPPSTKYHPEHHKEIGHTKSSTINLAVSQGRFQQPNCHKEKLLLGKLKNQFKDYIQGEVDLQTLQQGKRTKIDGKVGSPLKKTTEKLQFFMARENRFSETNQKSKEKETKRNVQGIGTKSINLQDSSVSVQNQYLHASTLKKEPFGIRQQRFKEQGKENLGPGSYDFKQEGNHGVSLVQNEQRFKNAELFSTPGPGSYSTDPLSKPQREKVQFNHHFVRDKQGRQENRFNSMEDLYQQVGRHMNYYHKMEKEGNRSKQSNNNSIKQANERKMQSLEQVKIRIRDKIGVQEQRQLVGREVNHLKLKSPRHIHMYEYNRPNIDEVRTGPGCYQIGTSLNKKSFNISSPPSYD